MKSAKISLRKYLSLTLITMILLSSFCVATAKTISPDASQKGYTYVLYNSLRIDDNDFKAIRDFASNNLENPVLKDVSSYNSANQIYDVLKADSKARDGILNGIQIFGSAPSNRMSNSIGSVPAFDIGYKVAINDEKIDDMGSMNTDFFYSTFKNDSSLLNRNLSAYSIFKDNLNISLIPEWPVVRVPLEKGEIAPYLAKYKEYATQTQGKILDTVNFSNPIFPQKVHSDDMGQFIQKRLDNEFHIIDRNQYRLYGNLRGVYPVQTNVLGDLTKDNLTKENSKGIVNFFINAHGQPDNIDIAFFDKTSQSADGAKRDSMINKDNINDVLNKNCYNLFLWSCNSGYDLRNDNIAHKAMTGDAVNVLASTTVLSNNGVHNNVSLEDMKKNNFYYFEYVFFNDYYLQGKSISESFFDAKRAYIQEILKNTNIFGDGNYQFNLTNAFEYQDLGLLEKGSGKVIKKTIPQNTRPVK